MLVINHQSSEWSLSQDEESHWRNLLIVRDAVNKAIEAARAHKYVDLSLFVSIDPGK